MLSGTMVHTYNRIQHSNVVRGTLQYRCKIKNGVPTWKNEYKPGALRSYKGTAGGLAIQLAASKDSETAADTSALSGKCGFCFRLSDALHSIHVQFGLCTEITTVNMHSKTHMEDVQIGMIEELARHGFEV